MSKQTTLITVYPLRLRICWHDYLSDHVFVCACARAPFGTFRKCVFFSYVRCCFRCWKARCKLLLWKIKISHELYFFCSLSLSFILSFSCFIRSVLLLSIVPSSTCMLLALLVLLRPIPKVLLLFMFTLHWFYVFQRTWCMRGSSPDKQSIRLPNAYSTGYL